MGFDTFLSLSCIVNIFFITFLSQDNQQNNKASPDVYFFQFAWHKYLYRVQFQAINVITLNIKLRRDAQQHTIK